MLPAFDTPSGLPWLHTNLKTVGRRRLGDQLGWEWRREVRHGRDTKLMIQGAARALPGQGGSRARGGTGSRVGGAGREGGESKSPHVLIVFWGHLHPACKCVQRYCLPSICFVRPLYVWHYGLILVVSVLDRRAPSLTSAPPAPPVRAHCCSSLARCQLSQETLGGATWQSMQCM